MATVQQQTRPPRRDAVGEESRFIEAQIRKTRRSLKLVDLTAGAITAVVGLTAFLLLAAILDHWVVPGGLTVGMRAILFALLAAVGGWYCWRRFVPLLRPINPVYAAHTIEQGSGSLKNSLLNLLLLRNQSRRLSEKVYQAIEKQAAQRLAQSPGDTVVDRTIVLRAGYCLIAVLAICALYAILSPKNLATSAGRVLAPWTDVPAPSRVAIVDVQPGQHAVARGERITVSARVVGAREDEPVLLRYSSLDGQRQNESATMRANDDGSRYELQLPPPADRSRAIGIQQDLNYWIECGDGRSKRFRLTVYDRPTIVVQRVRYEYPAYTAMPSVTAESAGDISAVEGTTVAIEALANYPINSAVIDFDANGTSDLRMRVDGDKAVASFKLRLREDRRSPAHASYMLRFTTEDGRQNRDPAKYVIDVTPDYAPEVRIASPAEPEVNVHVDETLPISVEASDPDFLLAGVQLKGRTAQRELEIRPLLADRSTERFAGTLQFTPSEYQLRPGDMVEYWAQASDNRRPEANVAFSERRRLKIVGRPQFDQDAPQRKQDQQNGGGNEQDQQSGEGTDGAGGVSGGEGEQGEPSDGESGEGGEGQSGESQDGDNQTAPSGEGQGGQQGDQQPQPAGDNQSDSSGQSQSQQQSSEGSDSESQRNDSRDATSGGERSTEPTPGESSSQPSKVSPDGDDDAAAFERIKQHLEQQESGDAESQQETSSDGDAQQQPGSQDDRAGGESTGAEQSGQNPGDAKQQGGDNPLGSNQQKDDANSEQGGTPAGDSPQSPDVGGQSKPSGQQSNAGDQQRGQEQGVPQGESGEQEQDDPSRQGPETNADGSQGDQGAGAQSGAEDEGVPQTAPDAPREKTPGEPNEQLAEGGDPPSASQSKRESDSRGGQQGDQSGGGGRGGGQASDEQGRGASGQNEASEQGAGAAPEQGDGPTGDGAGQDQLSDGQTGQSSENQPGDGSQSGQSQGSQSNEPNQGGADQRQSPATDGSRGGDQTGRPEAGDRSDAADDRNAAERNAADPAPSTLDQPNDATQREGGSEGGAQSSPTGGGNAGRGAASSSSASEVQPGDDPNLKYAQEQTDLVLNRISDQLADDNVDRGLLEKLGWNQEQLQRFVNRWQGLKSRAQAPGDAGEQARRELNEALQSLGLGRQGGRQFQVEGQADQVKDLATGATTRPPLEYRDSVRAYTRGASAAERSNGDE